MKNRLQFNRIPALFSSGVTYLSGTTIGVSGREKAYEALSAYTKQRDFIPLIGEPIVVRYIDDKGKKQAILAIGKATGSTSNDTHGVEYHIIDTAKLQEDIDLANANAAEALDLASAATHDIANHLVILKNMIGPNGIFMEDASFFDGESDDPSNVGLYKNWSGNPTPYPTTYISGATNMFEADLMLDAAIKEQSIKIEVLSGVTQETIDSLNELWEKASELSAVTAEFSASTVNELNEIESDLGELSAATKSFSAASTTLFDTIIEAAGLNDSERGSYPGHDETHIIKDATSLDNADVLLDAAIWAVSGTTGELSDDLEELSAATVTIEENLAETNEKLEELSAATVTIEEKENNIIAAEGLKEDGTYDHERAHDSNYFKDAFDAFKADEMLDSAIADLSANTMAADHALDEKIDELSANTMAADQALQDQIDELGNRRVLGVSAITVETLENGDSKVSLLINEEDDKVLTQNTLGLKANLSLTYVRDDKKIYLKGKNDVIISEINAEDFIKDGMLSAASVFTATEEDHEHYPELVVGKTYIKLIFNEAGQDVPGRAHPVFISAEDLVDIYTVAPESYTYMEINDYVIKLNVDQENGLASYNYARNISAVTTNIISATGLNMGEQGGYPGHDETHYIKNAVNLDNADVLLDEAIWGVHEATDQLSADTHNAIQQLSADTHHSIEKLSADTHNAIQNLSADTHNTIQQLSADTHHAIEKLSAGTESKISELSGVTAEFSSTTHTVLENIIAGAGLSDGEQGGYPGHDETHIIKDAASLDNADVLLDDAVWILSGNVITLSGIVYDLSGATDDVYNYVDEQIESLSGSIVEYVTDIEEVTAAALNDLNDRLNNMDGAHINLTGYEIYSGDSEDDEIIVNSGDTVNDAFGKLQKQIIDNELVTAAALNDLNDRVLDNEEDINITNNMLNVLSGVVASFSSSSSYDISILSSATVSLSSYTQHLGDEITNLSAFTQYLSGKTLGTLTINVNGEQQGKYCPSASTTLDLEVIQEVTGEDVLLTGYELVCGTTEEELNVVPTDNANQAFGKLQRQIYNNELVISAAFNDLNDRITELSGNTGGSEGPSGTYITSNTVSNITFSTFLTVIEVAGQGTGSPIPLTVAAAGLPELPANGVREAHVIIENTANAIALVKLSSSDTRLKLTTGDEIYIEPHGIGELNAMITYDGSTYTIYIITT